MPAVGILSQTLADEAEGTLVLTGFVQGLDTSAFSEGDTLYIAATGGLTNTTPAGEANLIQNIGKVIKVHASNGSIMVTGAGRANATSNLDDGNFFLGNASNQAETAVFATEVNTLIGASSVSDLSDVSTATASDGDVLVYNTTSGEWVATTPSSGTISENLTNWSFDTGATWEISEQSNNMYFTFSGVHKMKVDGSGNVQVTGDVTTNATITGGSTTSLYFSLSNTKYLELTVDGDLFVAGSIDSNATIV